MKFKTTRKAINDNYVTVIKVGYCDLQWLLYYDNPIAYNAGVYGWNCDIYEITPTIAISTGYNPFGNIRAPLEICRKYDEMAEHIVNVYKKPFEEKRSELRNLLNELVKEVTK